MAEPVVDPSVIALAGIIVAGVAATAGPIVQLLTTRATLGAQRRQAAIERRQRRLESTYRGTIAYLLHQRDWAVGTSPMMTIGGEPKPPEPMPRGELAAREAEVVTNGSPDVLARLNAIVGLGQAFRNAVWYYQSMRESPVASGDEAMKAHEDLEACRKALRDAIEAALRAINAELREE